LRFLSLLSLPSAEEFLKAHGGERGKGGKGERGKGGEGEKGERGERKREGRGREKRKEEREYDCTCL
jgi:hypothetical protein